MATVCCMLLWLNWKYCINNSNINQISYNVGCRPVSASERETRSPSLRLNGDRNVRTCRPSSDALVLDGMWCPASPCDLSLICWSRPSETSRKHKQTQHGRLISKRQVANRRQRMAPSIVCAAGWCSSKPFLTAAFQRLCHNQPCDMKSGRQRDAKNYKLKVINGAFPLVSCFRAELLLKMWPNVGSWSRSPVRGHFMSVFEQKSLEVPINKIGVKAVKPRRHFGPMSCSPRKSEVDESPVSEDHNSRATWAAFTEGAEPRDGAHTFLFRSIWTAAALIRLLNCLIGAVRGSESEWRRSNK